LTAVSSAVRDAPVEAAPRAAPRGVASVRVVGHPFGPLGISRVARCTFASLRAAGMRPLLIDVWEGHRRDAAHERSLGSSVTRGFGDVNIFHLNGDEVETALDRLGGLPATARNICFPMWELPRYPREWAQQLERFDEVWAGSRFIADTLGAAVSVPVFHAPIATEAVPAVFRGRRYFGIPEAAYAFLFFFDLRSYTERKNPDGVIEAFRLFLAGRPWAQASLVVKVHGTANAPEAAESLRRALAELGTRAVLIDRQLDEDDVHGLIHACDAFVSLHRAEGYGLGLAEAMSLSRPVVGTAYSGNLDFMSDDVARMVGYDLVAVPAGAYPHWEDQVWAEPDVAAAARHMTELYDDPAAGRELGRRAGRHMRVNFSFRACGLRYRERIESLVRPGTKG
jgi:glycosyltransferase involved in cell wall biosynthesis